MARQPDNSPPTILLLGASADQVHAIRTAKAMGLRVLTVDMNPGSPGFALADDHAVISTRDVKALKHFLSGYRKRGHAVSGVLVMGSDIPHVVAEIADYLGTPGMSRESARIAVHKYKMKQRLQERGVPVPWFSLVHSLDELKSFIRTRGHRLVIKPVDRSGARGVFRLTEGCDPGGLYEQSKSLSYSGQVMVEEYLDGLQISTESVMYKGKAYTPGFADRNYEMLDRYAPHVIENGGWVPSSVTPGQRRAVESLAEKAALALGVTDGVAKGDVVLTENGPALIEMAARLSGGDFCESLIPLGCGVNIVEAAIDIALGREPDTEKLKPRWSKGVVNRYFFPPPGRLVSIEGVADVLRQEWVRKLEFAYKPGDVVPVVKSHADRFGVFIAVGDTREEAVERAERVYRTIKITTIPG